ncbi:hypothetical protein [Tropicimonas sp. IMCC6043]|uniref:hypothetical protein n=1 Tax=Tropicimonas sp. IMCC6043 TaxID=2510645 RepID=UPI001F5D1C83|nr:hypothetical protein [Tropicimonas sp. IMCC6043]
MEATSTPEDAATSRPARGSWSEAAPAPEERESEEDEEDEDDLRTLPPRRSVHESAMSILREEAAREQAVRHRETGGLETQGELDIPPPARSVRDPARVLPSDTLPPPAARAERSSPRRDRLPDVEEINSSLDPADTMSAHAGHRTTEAEARSRGQRLGFGLALLLFGTAAVVYVQAGRLAHALPDAAPVLERYVVTVDSGRLWLDRTLRDAVTPGGNSSQ